MQEYILKLTPQEMQAVVNALHEAPYRVVAVLLGKIHAQAVEQERAAQEKVA